MTNNIRLANLERAFQRGDASVQALRQLDLTIEQGEFIALVGPSGSGKSTLLNLLGGLDRPTGGEVWLNDLALHEADSRALTAYRKERIGFIFQSFNLLPRLTALENVAVPLMLAGVDKREREERAQAMLERVGLGHRLDHYPTELSGGEQQRTAVARALIHKPDLILADEPTASLDPERARDIMQLLEDLSRETGKTLVASLHSVEQARRHFDRVVGLRAGRLVFDAAAAELSAAQLEDLYRLDGRRGDAPSGGVP